MRRSRGRTRSDRGSDAGQGPFRVLVSAGDEVEAGQGVLVVEAMKMQNEMKAPVGGRIAAINVKENDSVNAGALLAVIEPSAPEPGR